MGSKQWAALEPTSITHEITKLISMKFGKFDNLDSSLKSINEIFLKFRTALKLQSMKLDKLGKLDKFDNLYHFYFFEIFQVFYKLSFEIINEIYA